MNFLFGGSIYILKAESWMFINHMAVLITEDYSILWMSFELLFSFLLLFGLSFSVFLYSKGEILLKIEFTKLFVFLSFMLLNRYRYSYMYFNTAPYGS